VKSDEFIREVDEEIQQEKMSLLWRQYGALVIGGAVLLVAATAGIVGWQNWQANSLLAQGRDRAAAEAALAQGDFAGAAERFSAIAEASDGGPAAIAALGVARAHVEAGDIDAAVAALDGLAARSDVDILFRDLAALQSVQLRLDTADPEALLAELEPLAAAGAPWQHSAREAKAIAAMRAAQDALAIETLTGVIEDALTPDAMRQRARELLLALGGDLPQVDASPFLEGDGETSDGGDGS